MKNGKNGDTYHISTNEVISIRNLVESICHKLNVNISEHIEYAEERVGKDSAYHLDSNKIRNELNWYEAISLDKGINDCIDWANENFETLPFY